jgi:hypothetical protein
MDRIRNSGREGSSLLVIFEGEGKGSLELLVGGPNLSAMLTSTTAKKFKF